LRQHVSTRKTVYPEPLPQAASDPLPAESGRPDKKQPSSSVKCRFMQSRSSARQRRRELSRCLPKGCALGFAPCNSISRGDRAVGLAGGHSRGRRVAGGRAGRREVALCPRLKGCGAARPPTAIIAQARVPVQFAFTAPGLQAEWREAGVAGLCCGAAVTKILAARTEEGDAAQAADGRPRAPATAAPLQVCSVRVVVAFPLRVVRLAGAGHEGLGDGGADRDDRSLGSRGSCALRATPTAPLSAGSGKPPHSRDEAEAERCPKCHGVLPLKTPDLEPVLVRPGQARRRTRSRRIPDVSLRVESREEPLNGARPQPSAAWRTRGNFSMSSGAGSSTRQPEPPLPAGPAADVRPLRHRVLHLRAANPQTETRPRSSALGDSDPC
uniref:Translation initiation factor IF-2-like n=1 Tax=Macrostomum lignano TaxID=282301 RepID=A0A1I8FFJ7_9PLAT